jgi:prephenate dehydrogenase
MQLAILGLGLIGGSVARSLRQAPAAEAARWQVAAWSPSGLGPALAAADGVVDRCAGSIAEAVEGADLVVLAAPPLDCLRLLDELGGPLRGALAPGTVITDVASTKVAIVGRAAQLGLRFVGGHPMAGLESTGYAASRADLFSARPWVIVPSGDAAAEAAVAGLAAACGALPLRLAAAEHDAAVASISHLPLVLSAALVETVSGTGGEGARAGWPQARSLAAGGWQSMTRLARGDPAMGAGIVATNAAPIAAQLRELRALLGEWLEELEREDGPDPAWLEERLHAARRRAGELP